MSEGRTPLLPGHCARKVNLFSLTLKAYKTSKKLKGFGRKKKNPQRGG
jgi:hypothetical protein